MTMRIRLFFLFILLWISPIAFSCAEELSPDNIIDNTEQSTQEIQSYTMSIVADKVFDEAEYSKALLNSLKSH